MGDKILDTGIQVWDVDHIQIGRIWAANTAKAMANTVTEVTEGATYELNLLFGSAHGYLVGSHLRIGTGTTSYNSSFVVKSVIDASNVEVDGATYVADETGLTAVIQPAVAPGVPFRILETRLHVSGTCATENFTITLDSGFHATYLDVGLFSQAMASVTSVAEDWSDTLKLFTDDDAVLFGFANANGINWGLESIYQFLSA